MKKIYLTLPSGTYLVGYSTSLRSFLESIAEDIDIKNALSYVHNESVNVVSTYHKGHNKQVVYQAVEITNNEKCFLKI